MFFEILSWSLWMIKLNTIRLSCFHFVWGKKRNDRIKDISDRILFYIRLQLNLIERLYWLSITFGTGTTRSGLPAHQVSDHPHRHQAREHPHECQWAVCPEARSRGNSVAKGWGASPLRISKYGTCTDPHIHVCIHKHSLYSSDILFSVSTAPAPKQVQSLMFSF